MNGRAWLCGLAMVAVTALTGAAVAACGGHEAAFPNVKVGQMPADQTWPGVYYNPVYGYLHMLGQEGNIVGRWKRTDSSHWGELNGTIEGNILRFKWTEHTYGAVGPSADLHGTGVFAYKMGANDVPELDGQYALEDSDKTGDWHCIKQIGLKPDLSSINGDSPTGAPTQDQWK
jgi:hypothetical protein